MAARLIPNDAIPAIAEQIDSPGMFRLMRHFHHDGFVMNGEDVSERMAALLRRMTELGLVDAGFEEASDDKPYMWTSNGNGSRVLRFIEQSASLRARLDSRFRIHSRAQTALSAISEWNQAMVLVAAEALQGRDPASWPRGEAVRAVEDKPVYLLYVSPDWRAFIRVLDSGEIELNDIVRRETLELFREREKAVGVRP